MKSLNFSLIIVLIYSFNAYGITDGTTGIPLGGIGTGAVKFNASAGRFSSNFRTPTRDGNYTYMSETQFQIFSQRGATLITSNLLKAVQKNGRVDDDAVFPLHRVNFGEINGVSVKMTAYMPYDPKSIQMMSHPAVFYEFTLNNLESSSVTSAIAFQLKSTVIPEILEDFGFTAKDTSLELSLIGGFPDGPGELSYGSDSGFFTNGYCNNTFTGFTNRLALCTQLDPNETKKVRFVLAWYQPDEEEHYYYANIWNNAKEVAFSAMNNFDTFQENAEELVNRMRASNLPDWLVDQVLNTAVNLVNNSIYFKDGRYCHTEGQWEPEGTMDQMWHTRQIYAMINPELSWMELEWWARTQHVTNYSGQIHHDFGTDFNYVSWDDTEHEDYRDIHEWVDLNCGFIISVYETFIATADSNKLAYFWPYVKKAAKRILNQVGEFGSSEFPYTLDNSLSTYDAGGNSQAYNTGLSVVTYKIMMFLGAIMQETSIVNSYQSAYETAVSNFEARWLDQSYVLANYCESVLAGPWIANYLKMDSFWEKQKLDNLYISIVSYYDPLNQGMGYAGGSYSEWQPYLVGHLGGYALQTDRSDVWEALQRDMYERNYYNRNLVFNHELGIPPKVTSPIWIASSTDASDQYISIPVLWRNYYNITGYHHNKYTGELWLEPKLFESLEHELDSAVVITPSGYVTIDYKEYGESSQNQEIVIKPDKVMEVNTIYIWDKYSDSLSAIDFVRIDGIDKSYSRVGSGDMSHLKIDWSDSISSVGITIQVEGNAKETNESTIPDAPEKIYGEGISPYQVKLSWEPVSGDVLGYILDIKKGTSFERLAIAGLTDTTYLDAGLLASAEYTYRVRCYNSKGISNTGPEVVVTTKPALNGEVIYALNAGGSNFTSSVTGIEYVNDASTGWVTSGREYTRSAAISGTEDDAIYITERFGNFSYNIPVENDTFNVVLKFAEIYHDDPGSRIFHVDIEGKRVLKDFDINFRTGKNTAYDVSIPVIITDGTLNISFVTVTDNAKLSALEVRNNIPIVISGFSTETISNQSILGQNYPNPVSAQTIIDYSIPEQGVVTLKLFDIRGKEVSVLVNEQKQPGRYRVTVNDLNSGIYIYKLQINDQIDTKKMVVL